jgi:outer membrane protein assembly factor BamA
MRRVLFASLFSLACVSAPAPAFAQGAASPSPAAEKLAAEVLADVRVHGNHSTPDADVITLSGLTVGGPLEADAVEAVRKRLRSSGRFTSVEVRKRYQSLTDTSRVVLVLLVSEPARALDIPNVPIGVKVVGPMHRLRDGFMFMPLISYADGYGFTYGARATFADVLGKRGRLTMPLTWGGVRRAALEGEKRFTAGPFSRVAASASVSQRENPHYRLDDRRLELGARAERQLVRGLRVGGGVGWTDVSFGGPARGSGLAPAFDLDDRFVTLGADVTLDTRVDPTFPRNAIYATAGWEALRFDGGTTIGRVKTEARGYIGLFGQSVLSLRARYLRTDAPLPAYEQSLLGGASTLRGYRAGSYAGDTLLATSAELRVPLTSPLKMGKSGVTVFMDSGAVAPYGARLRDQPTRSGAGVGLFFIATVFQLNLDVAKGFDGGTRVHLMTGFSF